MSRISLIVPCYNEEEVLDDTIKQLSGVISDLIIKKKISKKKAYIKYAFYFYNYIIFYNLRAEFIILRLHHYKSQLQKQPYLHLLRSSA